MPGPVFLEGDAVSLRPVEREDLAFLTQWSNRPEVRVDSGITGPVTREDRESWFEDSQEDDSVVLLACTDGEPVGVVGLKDVDERAGTAGLWYWIVPEYQGNGYATEAAGRIVDYGFRQRRLHKIVGESYAYNDGSIRVLEKLGFEREGIHREEAFVDGERVDVHRYGLLVDEWRE